MIYSVGLVANYKFLSKFILQKYFLEIKKHVQIYLEQVPE